MVKFFNDAKKIYSLLSDDLSKKIYSNMVLYNLTKDESFFDFKTALAFNGLDLYKIVQSHKTQPIALFGAGRWGKRLLSAYPDIPWRCCVDNNRKGLMEDNTKILSVDELHSQYPNAFIVIAVKKYSNEIKAQLRDIGFEDENIYEFTQEVDKIQRSFMARQYFDLPALPHDEQEVFVDAGGCDGESSLNFIKWANEKYKHIYLFEANSTLSEKCCKNLEQQHNCTIIGKGLWNEQTTLTFRESPYDQEYNINLQEHNAFDKEHENLDNWTERTIDVVRMDDVILDERVTFIKMDIEGSEVPAIQGAERIIRTYKPKMAVCVYHKQDDLWAIPSLLLKLRPDYHFYLRTYSLHWGETVLYAV